MELPTVTLTEVFHLGTLDPARRGQRFNGSYEGHGLSVSLDPSAWRRIAKLGGEPLWSLRKEDGCFLDAHSLDEEQRQQITQWALGSGYAIEVECWQVVYYDSELDSELAFLLGSAEEAVVEAEGLSEAYLRTEQVRTLRGTERFVQETGLPAEHGQFDQLLSLYVAQESDLDGVWWQDEESFWSAPRGCICHNRLSLWTKELIKSE